MTMFGRIVCEEDEFFLLLTQQIDEPQCSLEQLITQVKSAIHIQQEATNGTQFLDGIHRQKPFSDTI
jgi:hypothetical protein